MEECQPGILGTRLVPEKRALCVATQSRLHSHFWNGAVKSTRTPDGVISSAPSEPAPLATLAPSGLSRPQFLQATQAVGIPATPSFSGSQGGVVVDRALSMHGGHKWWAAFVGRVKLQELLARQRGSGTVKAVVDPSLYALHGVLRARPSRNTFVRATLQADSLACLVAPPAAGPPPKLAEAVSASSEITAHIRNHRLTGRLSANELVLSAPASYSRAPLTATVDLEPLPQRRSPFIYRVGLHQTVLRKEQKRQQQQQQQQQPQPAAAAAAGASTNGVANAAAGQHAEGGGARGGAASSSGRDLLQDFLRACSVGTAAQGAVAVHGTTMLWQSGTRCGNGSGPPAAADGEDDGGPAHAAAAPAASLRPAQRHPGGSYLEGGEGSESGARLITAGDVLAALSDSAGSLRGATQQLREAAGWVASGAFREALQGRGGGGGPEAGRQPRSGFLAGPHLQATVVLGAAGRVGFNSTGGLAPPTLTPFASGGLSLQLGQFARPLLDFTRLSAQLDLGLPRSPPTGASAAPLGPLDAGASATLSVTQQLYGPLRVCADCRLALDSGEALAPWRAHPREQAGRAAAHLKALRPSLLDAAYALDVVVPGSKGLARVVAWYAPLRKEGMVELRVL